MRSLVAMAALVMAIVPASARADADPASDVLLGTSVFYPYSPAVSGSLQRSLNGLTTAAARAHFPIKVALIGSPVDLGAIPSFFGKPQPYASFLDQELGVIGTPHPPLLVVMPHGYGVAGLRAPGKAAVSTLATPTGSGSNPLAQAAIVAVRRLAAASGHPIGNAPAGSPSGGGGSSAAAVLGVAAAAVAAATAITALRRRRRAP